MAQKKSRIDLLTELITETNDIPYMVNNNMKIIIWKGKNNVSLRLFRGIYYLNDIVFCKSPLQAINVLTSIKKLFQYTIEA